MLHPARGTHPKSIRAVRVHLESGQPGRTYLAASSSLGDGVLSPVLVPVPRLDEIIIGKRKGIFGEARAALHEAAAACTDRVNLIWPAVVARGLAVEDPFG